MSRIIPEFVSELTTSIPNNISELMFDLYIIMLKKYKFANEDRFKVIINPLMEIVEFRVYYHPEKKT
jgi:hypothetical protein